MHDQLKCYHVKRNYSVQREIILTPIKDPTNIIELNASKKKTKPFHSRGLQLTTITSKCVVSHSCIYHIQQNHQNPIVSVLEHFD